MEAVVVEEHAGTAVHVREGVLRLAVFLQHGGGDFGVESDELEDGGGGDGGAGGGEFHKGGEARVGVSEDGVPVAGDHAAGFEGGPEVGFYGGGGDGGADVGLHLQDPAEDFLGCESGRRGLVADEEGKGCLKVEELTRVVDRQGLAIQRCS